MVVVVIIGLLAAMAMPALGRVRVTAQNARFISDLRTFTQAFETYAMQHGTWPANAASGVVPTGMAGDFNQAAWSTRNSVGGLWNWDRNINSIAAGVSTTNVAVTDEQMTAIDHAIDDGNLFTGSFRKINGRYTAILQR